LSQKLTIISFELTGGYYDLGALHVVGFWNWMVHNTYGPNDLVGWLKHRVGGVGWVADNERGTGLILTSSESFDFTLLVKEKLIDILIEHECTAMNGAKSRESLWQTTKTINWIKEWTASISSLRVDVELLFH
jgi:hypothetical protein